MKLDAKFISQNIGRAVKNLETTRNLLASLYSDKDREIAEEVERRLNDINKGTDA